MMGIKRANQRAKEKLALKFKFKERQAKWDAKEFGASHMVGLRVGQWVAPDDEFRL